MKKENLLQKTKKDKVVHSAKECAYLAVFVSLVIAIQLILSVLPGIELVTVLFVSFSFVMGGKRGVIAVIILITTLIKKRNKIMNSSKCIVFHIVSPNSINI